MYCFSHRYFHLIWLQGHWPTFGYTHINLILFLSLISSLFLGCSTALTDDTTVFNCCSRIHMFCYSFVLVVMLTYPTIFYRQSSSKKQGAKADQTASLLEKSCDLIRNFPEYYDVVVSVARKTDGRHWADLFSAAGRPTEYVTCFQILLYPYLHLCEKGEFQLCCPFSTSCTLLTSSLRERVRGVKVKDIQLFFRKTFSKRPFVYTFYNWC